MKWVKPKNWDAMMRDARRAHDAYKRAPEMAAAFAAADSLRRATSLPLSPSAGAYAPPQPIPSASVAYASPQPFPAPARPVQQPVTLTGLLADVAARRGASFYGDAE